MVLQSIKMFTVCYGIHFYILVFFTRSLVQPFSSCYQSRNHFDSSCLAKIKILNQNALIINQLLSGRINLLLLETRREAFFHHVWSMVKAAVWLPWAAFGAESHAPSLLMFSGLQLKTSSLIASTSNALSQLLHLLLQLWWISTWLTLSGVSWVFLW